MYLSAYNFAHTTCVSIFSTTCVFLIQSWWSRLGTFFSNAFRANTYLRPTYECLWSGEGFEFGDKGREGFQGHTLLWLKRARVRRSSIRWWTFETRMT